MSERRPDPDQLLDRLREDEARARRGRLRIFFGASPGVGKTYAMLSSARQQLLAGVDTVIGVVETHGRMETEVMADGIERLPLRDIDYRERHLREFDLDGALARAPALILMDELAHSNAPGSRHPKRWQDVEELLNAGIDVYSTVNVQHLESLNDVVGGITGIRVRETVPDHAFDLADEVVLVDLPADELLQRLKEGKVYLPHQAERAVKNFFRKGNLMALRELALRRTADRVDVEMLQYRRDQSVSPIWQTRDSLLVCVGPGGRGERLVRSAARLAGRLEVPWHAIYVETPELQRLSRSRRQEVLKTLKLAQELGAQTATLADQDAVDSVIRYARDHNLSKVLVGRDRPRSWRPWYRSFADRLGHCAPDLDVLQIAREEAQGPRRAEESSLEDAMRPWRAPAGAWLGSLVACAAAAAIGYLIYTVVDLTNIAMVFLLAVVLVALRLGRGPAALAAVVGVALFDFLFVPPRYSFAVSDVQYLMTFIVMLAVGLITGQMTAGLKFQARVANTREFRMRALYELSRELSGALLPEQIAEISERFVEIGLDARMGLVLADDEDRLEAPRYGERGGPSVDMSIAQWAFDHGEAAGVGTDTLTAAPLLYQPLKAPMRIRGVLALEPKDPRRLLIPEQRRLLETFCRLVAIALERVHYVNVAQNTTVQMESERLRNSLLAAISHDLRTPLTSLIAQAEHLAESAPKLDDKRQAAAESIRDQGLRLSALVGNLLDMARLQAGHVHLNLQWQPLEEVIGSALGLVDRLLGERRVEIDIPADLPLLQFDAVLMERVVFNLLENACKYTPLDSRIDIAARIEGESLRLTVADNGPGLAPGSEENVFEKFSRGEKETSVSGVGLGLAICRAIVEAHQGRIVALNRPSGGANFVITLPLGNPPSVDADSALPAEPYAHFEELPRD